ncbi:MAG: DciA family protein [Phycisphaeraceae bacterium]
MNPLDPHRHIENLRGWRTRGERDLSLAFVRDYVKRTYAKPQKQLGKVVEVWAERVPEHLGMRTVLAALSRGVLTVHVADSATLYQLDRLLRDGLEQELRQTPGVTLRRVKLKVDPKAAAPPSQ